MRNWLPGLLVACPQEGPSVDADLLLCNILLLGPGLPSRSLALPPSPSPSGSASSFPGGPLAIKQWLQPEFVFARFASSFVARAFAALVRTPIISHQLRVLCGMVAKALVVLCIPRSVWNRAAAQTWALILLSLGPSETRPTEGMAALSSNDVSPGVGISS
jgi:hypothetical protein